MKGSRGLLGYFSSTQTDLIKNHLVTIGEPAPWGTIINPLGAAPAIDVEKARKCCAKSIGIHPLREPLLSRYLPKPAALYRELTCLVPERVLPSPADTQLAA